jgi:ribosome-associated translation inhibitor RaiA
MNLESTSAQSYEISDRFRASIEERIKRLEGDATEDEHVLASLKNEDHIRRHRRLIATQKAEALRMRLFLERSQQRLPRPVIGF